MQVDNINNKVILMFSNCIPVKGARRSIICDLSRNTFEFIPNSMYDFISKHNGQIILEIKSMYSDSDLVILDEYIGFLLDKEFALLCEPEEVKLFPEISTEWDFPALITNGVIDINENSRHNFEDILMQYEGLGCRHILIRSFVSKPISFWNDTLSHLVRSSFKSVEIVCKFSDEYTHSNITDFTHLNKRVRSIILSSSNENSCNVINGCNVTMTTKEITSNAHCGFISPKYFVVDNNLFFESLSHNNCLNRKLSIDVDGTIKNCPSLIDNYGNTTNTKLADVLTKSDFRACWSITKDMIEACRVCEFRYICTDCRAFFSGKEGSFSKPVKCSYDPFSATWL